MFATVSRNPNSPQIIEVLLKHGANVNAKNNRGETAADIAKRINRQDILSILEKYQ
ncbi:MAG: ankyrin repeat domain-containing protein [Alphaproteobacteria bacterium]|nr:ankyrin repeat domain-containing protein [Alphaproteobacteria bacterium]